MVVLVCLVIQLLMLVVVPHWTSEVAIQHLVMQLLQVVSQLQNVKNNIDHHDFPYYQNVNQSYQSIAVPIAQVVCQYRH